MCRASALTVPITCTRHILVPEVTSPPPSARLQPLHRGHHHLLDCMIPPRQSKTLSCRFDWCERTRPTRNTTFSPSFLKMTILSPLLRRKRRALTGGTIFGTLPWQGVVDFGPRSAAGSLPYFLPFSHFSERKKVVYPLDNLGASRTKFQSR